jgi:hypothetical protein
MALLDEGKWMDVDILISEWNRGDILASINCVLFTVGGRIIADARIHRAVCSTVDKMYPSFYEYDEGAWIEFYVPSHPEEYPSENEVVAFFIIPQPWHYVGIG